MEIKKSFTLIELLVAVTIFSLVSVMTIAVSAAIIGTRQKTKAISEVQRNAQNIIQVFSNEVKSANSCNSYIYDATRIYYFGFTSKMDPDAANPDYNCQGSPPSCKSDKLLTASFDLYSPVLKSFYLDGDGNLILDETVAGTSYSRQIKDSSVKINKIEFKTAQNWEIKDNCSDLNFRPSVQNFLEVYLDISSKSTNPKEYYNIKLTKYISAKNFRYIY